MSIEDCIKEVHAHSADARVLSDPEKSADMAIYLSYLCFLGGAYHKADRYFSIFLEGSPMSQLSGPLKELKQSGGYTRVLADETAKTQRSLVSDIISFPVTMFGMFIPDRVTDHVAEHTRLGRFTSARDYFRDDVRKAFHSLGYLLHGIRESPLSYYINKEDRRKAAVVLYRATLGIPVELTQIEPYIEDPGMEQRFKDKGYLKNISLAEANFLYSYVTVGGDQLKYRSLPNTFPKLALRAIELYNKGFKKN